MKLRLLLFGLIMFAIPSYSQSLIDLSRDEVEKVIKKERKDLSFDKEVVTQKYICWKFVDRKKDETLIVYFTKEDICKFSKSSYEYHLLNEVIENLNAQHDKDKVEEYKWKNGRTELTLTKKEWYFTVKTTKI